jgi:hypothetical protein
MFKLHTIIDTRFMTIFIIYILINENVILFYQFYQKMFYLNMLVGNYY